MTSVHLNQIYILITGLFEQTVKYAPVAGLFSDLVDWVVGSIGDAFEWAWDKTIGRLAEAVRDEIVIPVLEETLQYVLGTPYPENVNHFGPPSNDPWNVIYTDIYQPEVLTIAPMTFLFVMGIAFCISTFSDPVEARIATQRLVFVLPFIFSWWWFGAWFLRLNEILTIFLLDGTPMQFVEEMTYWLNVGTGATAGLVVYVLGAGI
jgi:hypothetical protein